MTSDRSQCTGAETPATAGRLRRHPSLPRRRSLALCAVAAVTALIAGCGDGGDSNDESTPALNAALVRSSTAAALAPPAAAAPVHGWQLAAASGQRDRGRARRLSAFQAELRAQRDQDVPHDGSRAGAPVLLVRTTKPPCGVTGRSRTSLQRACSASHRIDRARCTDRVLHRALDVQNAVGTHDVAGNATPLRDHLMW